MLVTKIAYIVQKLILLNYVNLIKMWLKSFEETGSTFKPRAKGRPRTSRNEANIESVKLSV